MLYLFIPIETNCAVSYSLNLILDNDLLNETYSSSVVLQTGNTNLSEIKSNPSDLLAVFAHYEEEAPNLKCLNSWNEEIYLDDRIEHHWELFQNGIFYGHICYGSNFLKKSSISNWVSYNNYIPLIYGFDPFDKLNLNFHKGLVELISNKNIKQIFEGVTTLYKSMINDLAAKNYGLEVAIFTSLVRQLEMSLEE